MPKVAVAILNWNGETFLPRFLPSVIAHSGTAEIIVIDNASTDRSLEILQNEFPSVTVIQNKENFGYSGGYNEGIKKITADYIILLNSDVEVTGEWIEPIIELMDKDVSIAAAQPKIKSLNEPHKFEYAGACGGFIDKDFYPFCRGRIFDLAEDDNGQYDSTTEIFWATGACMFVRKSAYDAVNGLDPDFFAHMEEIDLCWRMKNRGYKIMSVPGSVVYHLGGGTLNYNSPRKTYLNFRNNLFLIHKNYYTGNLFAKIVRRLMLDGIAGMKFFFTGKFKHTRAIFKAHHHYYRNISVLNEKRRELKKQVKNPNLAGIYKGSLLIDYFVRKKKKFSELDRF
jgi:GT2 family glycosyltransferase